MPHNHASTGEAHTSRLLAVLVMTAGVMVGELGFHLEPVGTFDHEMSVHL